MSVKLEFINAGRLHTFWLSVRWHSNVRYSGIFEYIRKKYENLFKNIVLRTSLITIKRNINRQIYLQYYNLQCLIGVNLKSINFVSSYP